MNNPGKERLLKVFLRILAFVRAYTGHFVGAICCAILFALLNVVNIWMFIPFFQVIFSDSVDRSNALATAGEEKVVSYSTDRQKDSMQRLKRVLFIERLKQKLRAWTEHIVEGRTKEETLKRVCLIMLGLFLLKNLVGYAQGFLMVHVEQGVARDVRNRLYEHLQELPLGFFHGQKTGALMSRITNDVNLLNEAINVTLLNLPRDPLTVMLFLGMLFLFSWRLTLMALVLIPFGVLLVAGIGRYLRKYSIRSQERMADLTVILQESITGMRVIKAFGMEAFEIRKFHAETQRLFRAIRKLFRVRRLSSPFTEFFGITITIGMMWLAGREVIRNQWMAPEEFLIFFAAMGMMMQPIKTLSRVYARIQIGLGAGQRVFEILDTSSDIVERPDAVVLQGLGKGIRFRNVSARYDEGEWVLRHIELTVRPGQVVAIVGPSGAGKSTLVDLVPRFYDSVEGSVEIDGVDLRDVNLASLRRLMGIVTQETILFNDTVANNIAYGLPDMDHGRIVEAARAANAHDFIEQFPQGYATVIGDRGVKLSGGQRQRLAIARAILKNPPLLILDEATSALDTESELLVQEAIHRLMAHRTTLVIAHRLSTIQHADSIIVLDRGRMVQQGTHEELLAQSGLYRHLYEIQFKI